MLSTSWGMQNFHTIDDQKKLSTALGGTWKLYVLSWLWIYTFPVVLWPISQALYSNTHVYSPEALGFITMYGGL